MFGSVILATPPPDEMQMVSNEVDILCEVTMEELQAMQSSNDKINAWYNEFPYATMDDRAQRAWCSLRVRALRTTTPDFRWAIVPALDIDQISMNIFSAQAVRLRFRCSTTPKVSRIHTPSR